MNVEEITISFYEWLIYHGYRDKDDFTEDINDMIEDFKTISETVPRLFNLLREISD